MPRPKTIDIVEPAPRKWIRKKYCCCRLDLQKCDRKFFENMDRFLQWFCAVIGRDMGVKAKPTDDWDQMFGADGNCEEFFEQYLWNDDDDRPLVIAIENLDRIFLHDAIEVDFCGLLRG